jgi:hypothetical protein
MGATTFVAPTKLESTQYADEKQCYLASFLERGDEPGATLPLKI